LNPERVSRRRASHASDSQAESQPSASSAARARHSQLTQLSLDFHPENRNRSGRRIGAAFREARANVIMERVSGTLGSAGLGRHLPRG